MDKDIITVLLNDGSKKDMELVLLYADEQTYKNYVLYKEMDELDECYAATYTMNGDNFQLDPNLTQEEIMKLQILLNEMLEENH